MPDGEAPCTVEMIPYQSTAADQLFFAMLVSSFTEQEITPDAMAWARDNHYWVSTSGSAHALIPEGAAYYGLSVEPFSDYTEQGMIQALHDESILVALVGPGHFTSSGHFIIIADYWSGSAVRIVDPNSLENTQIPWAGRTYFERIELFSPIRWSFMENFYKIVTYNILLFML